MCWQHSSNTQAFWNLNVLDDIMWEGGLKVLGPTGIQAYTKIRQRVGKAFVVLKTAVKEKQCWAQWLTDYCMLSVSQAKNTTRLQDMFISWE